MRFARPGRRAPADPTTGQHRRPAGTSTRLKRPGDPRRRRVLITTVTAICAVLVAVLALRDASGPSDPAGGAGGAGDPGCRPTALLEPPCGAWFGAFVPHDKADLADKVEEYEKHVDRRLDIVYTYHDMSAVTETRLEGQLLTEQEQQVGEDRMLLLSWESKWWGGTAAQQPTWKEIAAGELDETVIDAQAQRVKEYGERTGKKVFLSFDLEMDTRTPDNGTPADYVRAYRHIHDRFRDLGVDNVVWTWIITGYLNHSDLFERMYPGDGYVDWIGYNQYNYYRCHNTEWLSFAQTQYASHDWIRTHISDDKPLMLSEFGSASDAERPQRQADWYAQVPRVLKDLDGVRAALQWNYRDPGPHCDLAVANDRAWASLRKAAADPYLNQPLEREGG